MSTNEQGHEKWNLALAIKINHIPAYIMCEDLCDVGDFCGQFCSCLLMCHVTIFYNHYYFLCFIVAIWDLVHHVKTIFHLR